MTTAENIDIQSLPSVVQLYVKQGIITENDILQANVVKSKTGDSILSALSLMNLLDDEVVANHSAVEYGLPYVDASQVYVDDMVSTLFTQEQLEKLHVYPLVKIDKTLLVGVSDPYFIEKLSDIKFATGLVPEPVIIRFSDMNRLLYGDTSAAEHTGLSISSNAHEKDLVIDSDDLDDDDDGAELTKFVDDLLRHAIKKGVSDIHIEPYEKILRVRFRIDGILQVVSMPPIAIGRKLSARVKVLAELDTSERRIPQDGKIRFFVNDDVKVDLRINTLPVLYGEKIVMRVLDADTAALGIDMLGFNDIQKEYLLSALKKPDGMILVTGPTGSGKTVTLYAGLNLLNTSEKNISTAEDPAEIQVPGINQVNVNPKVGLTFASALRAFLRQDPDIVMVGEIRDLETAEISMKAAQTGHLVLSTLHTNSAPETLTRMLNMGIAPFNLASTVHLIVAQRLARRLCSNCRIPMETMPSDDVLKELGFKPEQIEGLELYEPVGCNECNNGYKGRVGIYQVMPVSEEMEVIIMNKGNALQLAEQAEKDGINDLRQSAVEKVVEGTTTLAELERVTKD